VSARPTPAEKKTTARGYVEQDPESADLKWLYNHFGVSERTVYNWVEDILKAAQYKKDAKLWWLSVCGWSSRQIGDYVGDTHSTVADRLSEICRIAESVQSKHSRGESVEEIAKAEKLPFNLVQAILLAGKDDVQRMKALKVSIDPYDVWTFSGCSNLFGAEYPGRVPGRRCEVAGDPVDRLACVAGISRVLSPLLTPPFGEAIGRHQSASGEQPRERVDDRRLPGPTLHGPRLPLSASLEPTFTAALM